MYDTAGQLVAEVDSDTGAVRVEYFYLNNQRLASIKNGQLYYVHHNHLGAPIALTDTTGNLAWAATYDAFGSITVNLDNVGGFRPRLPGQYEDAETGLYYNWHRYYDPRGGRYITSDPLGLVDGPNTYAYVGNNPVNKTDPLGLMGVGRTRLIQPGGPASLGVGNSESSGITLNPDGSINVDGVRIGSSSRPSSDDCECPEFAPHGPFYRWESDPKYQLQAYNEMVLYGTAPFGGGAAEPQVQAYRKVIFPRTINDDGTVVFCTYSKPMIAPPHAIWRRGMPGVYDHDTDTVRIDIYPIRRPPLLPSY